MVCSQRRARGFRTFSILASFLLLLFKWTMVDGATLAGSPSFASRITLDTGVPCLFANDVHVVDVNGDGFDDVLLGKLRCVCAPIVPIPGSPSFVSITVTHPLRNHEGCFHCCVPTPPPPPSLRRSARLKFVCERNEQYCPAAIRRQYFPVVRSSYCYKCRIRAVHSTSCRHRCGWLRGRRVWEFRK